jgi:hypothetical protein
MQKLQKQNGKKLQFQLTDSEEKVLRVIYYQAKAKLVCKDGDYCSENILFTNRVGEELTGFAGIKLTKILQRLVSLKLIKTYYAKDKCSAYRRYRYVRINCKAFDDKYCWSD